MSLCSHRQMLEELTGSASVIAVHPAVCFAAAARGSAVQSDKGTSDSIHHKTPASFVP